MIPRSLPLLALSLALAAGVGLSPAPVDASPAQKKARKAGGSTVQYRWVDDKGHTHFSDTLPQEALRQGRTVYRNGHVIDRVERMPTPEEAAAIQQAQAEAAAQEQAQAERDRAAAKARQIYGDAAAIKADFSNKREAAKGKIQALETSIRQTRRVLVERLDSAANFELAGKPIPKAQVADIQKLAGQIHQYRDQAKQEQARIDELDRQQAELIEMVAPAQAETPHPDDGPSPP